MTYYPWRGKMGDLRVGHKVFGATGNQSDIWEVIGLRNPGQIETNHTLWMRVKNTTNGMEFSIEPRLVNTPAKFALTEEELELAEKTRRPPSLPVTPADDAEAVALLVEHLGAQEIATRDHETGEITCPMHESGPIDRTFHHLRICHGIDTAGLEALEGQAQISETHAFHAREHGAKAQHVGSGGFPHRHVPEHHDIL